jgi:hypothetical protein
MHARYRRLIQRRYDNLINSLHTIDLRGLLSETLLPRRERPTCPPIGTPMPYGERTVGVVAEASGQRAVVEPIDQHAGN